jgi:hypothetical protein
VTENDEGPVSEVGFRIAVVFVGVTVLAALLFAIYVLAWNGGAHT